MLAFRNVLDLCLKFNVTRLVYTSSYNVIFSNKSLANIDETEPYPDDADQYDYYSRSKKAAEILLLKYDKTQLGEFQRSCARSGERRSLTAYLHRVFRKWGNPQMLCAETKCYLGD